MATTLLVLFFAFLPMSAISYADTAKPAVVARRTRLVLAIKDGEAYGLKVFAIQPGSVYERAGFRPGDTLLSVNGVRVLSTRSLDPLEAAVRASHGKPVRALVQRQGELLTLTP